MLKRMFKTGKIAKEIDIDWSSKEAAHIYLNASSPNLQISLRIVNRSLVPIVLDRMVLELWIGQPFAELKNIHRMPIEARQSIENHVTREYLSATQIKAFSSYLDGKQLKERLNIRADLFFDCDVGPFMVTKHIEHRGDTVQIS